MCIILHSSVRNRVSHHRAHMGKQAPAPQPTSTTPPGEGIAKIKLLTHRDILSKHANRELFRNNMTYAQSHMKEIMKREGIKRASKGTGGAIYYESVVAPSSDLVWQTARLVQRSGKTIIKAWHLQNVKEWMQGTAKLDPELRCGPKVPAKWRKNYLAKLSTK